MKRLVVVTSLLGVWFLVVAASPRERDSDRAERLGPYTRPGPEDTGLADPAAVRPRDTPLKTAHDAQVIENVDWTVTGDNLVVLHDRVTVRNCRFRGNVTTGGEGAVRSGVTIEHCEFLDAGGLGGGVSLYRCYVHGLRDADFWRNPSNCTWEGNFFEDFLATSTRPHIDIAQWYWSRKEQALTEANFTVRGNRWDIDNSYPLANQFNAILFNDQGLTHITWEYNWMKSGGYVIRNNADDATVQINHNVWEGWGWGPIYVTGYERIGFTGNRVVVNGRLVPFEKPPGTNSRLFQKSKR
jgi:hypothetical protein